MCVDVSRISYVRRQTSELIAAISVLRGMPLSRSSCQFVHYYRHQCCEERKAGLYIRYIQSIHQRMGIDGNR